MALLNHPNVVQIIDKDREDDLLYFVMEYVPGTSLDAVMGQRRLSLHEVFRVAKGICRGLEAAHRQNIIHRDLNPRNVLVSEDLTVVKLADFGISRVEEISRQQGTLSTSEISLGSLHYMSPEQATNMVEADHRTDIYSFGVTLYEMLTGRVPIGRFSLPSQVNNEVPSDIDPLVLKCLEVDSADRYATVTRVLADLNRLEDRLKLGLVHELKGISQQTSKIFLKSTGTLRRRKRQSLAVAVALLALAGGAGAFFVLRGRASGRGRDHGGHGGHDGPPAAPTRSRRARRRRPDRADPGRDGPGWHRPGNRIRFEAPEWPDRAAPAGPAAGWRTCGRHRSTSLAPSRRPLPSPSRRVRPRRRRRSARRSPRPGKTSTWRAPSSLPA